MEIYLVGGAVRDELLGLPVTEKDWVVVGSTPEEMLALGYRPVGKDFPVFLHPKTHEEYALARTERKVSKGYTGFKFYAAPDVTLEDDLKRRDLTINAIAKTPAGKLIDPYGGVTDLKNKVLHHVSSAFAEDPVRILRVARFAARFEDFTVHPETMRLMRTMVEAGEVDALVPERVWQELQRTLTLPYSPRFFEILKDCSALSILFPEIDAHFEVAIKALTEAANLQMHGTIRFAALTSCLTTQAIKSLCQRINVPNNYQDLALIVAAYQSDFAKVLDFYAEQILILLEKLDVFRRPERFEAFLLTCEVTAHKDATLPAQKLRQALQAAQQVQVQPLLEQGLEGEAIKAALHKKRRYAIDNFLRNLSVQ